MQPLAIDLKRRYPNLVFRAGTRFAWSPEQRQITYDRRAKDNAGRWSLLHETSHALLEHCSYANDFNLIEMEVAAWERAKHLAAELLQETIDEDHIQDCLDTYRDWLHRRSTCPSCSTKSLQEDKQHYRCFNCQSRWRVTPSRFCRSYRATIAT